MDKEKIIDSPLITAIITTYKRKPEIVKRAIDSIVSQTYENIEIILVNDSPESGELAEKLEALTRQYEGKVQYLPMPQNGGACAARNYGLENSHGEFISLLDDDDEWFSEKIEKMLPAFDADTVGIVYCEVENLFEQTGETRLRSEDMHTKPLPSGKILDAHFGENLIGSASFPVVRRSALEEVGGFNTAMPSLQDLEVWLKILRKYEARYVDVPLVRYHYYDGDRISTHPERRIKGYEIILEENREYLEKNPNAYAAYLRLSVTFYVNVKDFKRAWGNAMKAVRLEPRNIKANLFAIIKTVIRRFVPQRIA